MQGEFDVLLHQDEAHALSEFGVTHIAMPATPEGVWRAMGNGNGKA